jgi:hypothetical protein
MFCKCWMFLVNKRFRGSKGPEGHCPAAYGGLGLSELKLGLKLGLRLASYLYLTLTLEARVTARGVRLLSKVRVVARLGIEDTG